MAERVFTVVVEKGKGRHVYLKHRDVFSSRENTVKLVVVSNSSIDYNDLLAAVDYLKEVFK